MDEPKKEIWFPAKRYGWGWGIPCAWQGWVVMLVWIALVIVGATLLARAGHWVFYAIFMITMAAALTGICFWKGEKPRWRWGD